MRLLDHYLAVLANFQQAVQDMRLRLNSNEQHLFHGANALSERLRVSCEQARIELDAHVVAHGCGSRASATSE
jgi:hypothetical protein